MMPHDYNDDPFANPGEPKRGQCVLHRNIWFKPSDFPADEITEGLFATGVNQAALEEICARSKAKSIRFKGMTADDLSPLSALTKLQELDITWAHKFTDVSPLRALKNLKSLTISDNKRWHDLSQLSGMKITHLDISGGIWNTDRYKSLAPLADLPKLSTLQMTNVKVDHDGLRPLEACKALRKLMVSYNFPTEDYAYLSVKRPDIDCDAFAPYLTRKMFGDKDTMVIGSRKPFLNAKKDHARLQKYVRQFEELQEKFRAM